MGTFYVNFFFQNHKLRYLQFSDFFKGFLLIKKIFLELNTYKSDMICVLYLLIIKKKIRFQKIIFSHVLALNVSKNGPNDQLWRAITRSFLVQLQKTRYRCNRDIEIFKNFYSKYNFGLSVKKMILGPRKL